MRRDKQHCKSKGLKRQVTNYRTEEEPIFDPLSEQHFHSYFGDQRINILKEKIIDYHGKNFVINYQKKFNFEEEWEEKVSQSQKQERFTTIEETPLIIGSSVIIALVLVASLWMGSIDLAFIHSYTPDQKVESESFRIIYLLTIAILLLDWVLIIRKQMKINNNAFQCGVFPFFKDYYKQMICLVSHIYKVISGQPHMNSFFIIFQITSLIFVYIRFKELYKSLRLISYSLYYEYHSKICDLIITLFSILHLTAIVLYLSTFFGYQKTWLSSLDLDNPNQFIVYLYSFYYGSTTILTVGYGDISPKNPVEVVLIIIIQIVGIATHAFIISEITYCVSNLRKNRENIEKDLSIILKMKNHYKMKDNVVNEARSFIINSKPKVDQLSPQEEKVLLQKFNEELRNNISTDNSFSVVKSSVFFVIRWSINFQNIISKKLEHVLFSPNDLLYQPKEKERIYLIKSGKVDVYAQKNGRKKGQKNLLKTIKVDDSAEITNNCYGYTAAISTRPSRLYAISKDITSAYYIEKENFLHCLSQRQSDYEYYHEIKSKMDQTEDWQSFEVPLIDSSKHHFSPTKKAVIMKHLKNNSRNGRYEHVRYNRRLKMHTQIDENEAKCLKYKLSNYDSKSFVSGNNISELIEDSLQTITEEEELMGNTLKTRLFKEIVESFSPIFNIKDHFDHFFEVSKEFGNYFSKQNKSTMLGRFERVLFFTRQKNEGSLTDYQSSFKNTITR